MDNFINTDIKINEIVKSFENGTIARKNWGHAEHLIVANHYLATSEALSDAFLKMRNGIFNLLDAFGVDLTHEMPYHETLTMFWLQIIAEFRRNNIELTEIEMCRQLIAAYHKDFPLKFYSRERLFSEEARTKFIEGDLGTF